MDYFQLHNFAVKINNRMYRIVIEPGSPWEDIEQSLVDLGAGIQIVKDNAIKREQEAAANSSTQNDQQAQGE